MDPSAHLQADDLDGALAALTDRVRADPADVKLRIFLFQLLAVRGDWARAKTQLDTAVSMDPSLVMAGRLYGDAITCEAERTEIFAGKRSPTIFGEPQAWMASLVEAARLQASGAYDAAAGLREKAFDDAPTAAGEIDGQPFDWIADADSRFGPMLELIINGRYFWAPFMRIKAIEIEAPTDLRDKVWMPAVVTWSHGGKSGALIPSRYPGTERAADGGFKLARKTDWKEVAPDTYEGCGQRLFATDAGEYAVMDIRQITLETTAENGNV
ncbi:MAG TPA: type VI secretion system accessory protein TagJ [Aliidongia sp.]|nr:type VI secretion system accessory protein TagJ [Aliidongia sp.]